MLEELADHKTALAILNGTNFYSQSDKELERKLIGLLGESEEPYAAIIETIQGCANCARKRLLLANCFRHQSDLVRIILHFSRNSRQRLARVLSSDQAETSFTLCHTERPPYAGIFLPR